jgi:hypothetical protein
MARLDRPLGRDICEEDRTGMVYDGAGILMKRMLAPARDLGVVRSWRGWSGPAVCVHASELQRAWAQARDKSCLDQGWARGVPRPRFESQGQYPRAWCDLWSAARLRRQEAKQSSLTVAAKLDCFAPPQRRRFRFSVQFERPQCRSAKSDRLVYKVNFNCIGTAILQPGVTFLCATG